MLSNDVCTLYQGADGLPIGMHFVGRVGEDACLPRLARELEEAAPRLRPRPPPLP